MNRSSSPYRRTAPSTTRAPGSLPPRGRNRSIRKFQRFPTVAIIVIFAIIGGIWFAYQSGVFGAHGDPSPEARKPLAELESLPVRDNTDSAEYSRKNFSDGWKDPDHNGCDARNDVLARDLTGVLTDGKCRVLAGKLADPYTGKLIRFERGNETSARVQIDHVVPLANAWRSGADSWDSRTRLLFANDPANLLAVDGPTNAKKGASDASEWLPPNPNFRCEYVARQIAVKNGYGLSVTSQEKNAMRKVLNRC